MLLSYFDLVEEFEYSIWYLYAQKKGIFFVRSLRFVFICTILLLIFSQYWGGFYYIIFLQWFWIFHIYVNEIDFILNEDTNDNADFEYDDLSTDKDIAQIVSPRGQIIWARCGYLMNKKYSLINYMDEKILRYDGFIEFIFINNYKTIHLNYYNIFNYKIKIFIKVFKNFNLLDIVNVERININNNQKKENYSLINFLFFDYYFSKKRKLINYFSFTNLFLDDFFIFYLDMIKLLKNKKILKKNHKLFIHLNSNIVSYSFVEFGKNMILIDHRNK